MSWLRAGAAQALGPVLPTPWRPAVHHEARGEPGFRLSFFKKGQISI